MTNGLYISVKSNQLEELRLYYKRFETALLAAEMSALIECLQHVGEEKLVYMFFALNFLFCNWLNNIK